jgi:hypothetical protein
MPVGAGDIPSVAVQATGRSHNPLWSNVPETSSNQFKGEGHDNSRPASSQSALSASSAVNIDHEICFFTTSQNLLNCRDIRLRIFWT